MYSIDTSAMMTWWIRRYPPDVFPGLRQALEQLVAAGHLVASEYVLDELGGKHDPLYDWARAQERLFILTDSPVQQRAAELTAQYPILVDPASRRRNQADPFVIALADKRESTVVTQETYAKTKTTGKRKQRTYIPDVCRAEGIPTQGLTYYLMGRIDESIACYEEALRLSPRYCNALVNLGSALRKKGRVEEAIQCYRKALEVEPNNAAAHNNLGSAPCQIGKTAEGEGPVSDSTLNAPAPLNIFKRTSWLI